MGSSKGVEHSGKPAETLLSFAGMDPFEMASYSTFVSSEEQDHCQLF